MLKQELYIILRVKEGKHSDMCLFYSNEISKFNYSTYFHFVSTFNCVKTTSVFVFVFIAESWQDLLKFEKSNFQLLFLYVRVLSITK